MTFKNNLAILLMLCIGFASCKKKSEKKAPNNGEYTCTTCNQTPQGLAANDNSSKGIYKGIVIGSSGSIIFDIANATSNTLTAVFVIDGVKVNLTSTYSMGGGAIVAAPFKGTLNGQEIIINFSVEANGSGPTVVSAIIPGHPNPIFSLVKETSTVLARCFEGTYTTDTNKSGTFNIVVSTLLKGWTGKSRENGASSSTNISGQYYNNILYWGGNTEIGPIKGDTFEGKFNDGNGSNVTVKGKRTL